MLLVIRLLLPQQTRPICNNLAQPDALPDATVPFYLAFELALHSVAGCLGIGCELFLSREILTTKSPMPIRPT